MAFSLTVSDEKSFIISQTDSDAAPTTSPDNNVVDHGSTASVDENDNEEIDGKSKSFQSSAKQVSILYTFSFDFGRSKLGVICPWKEFLRLV